MSVTNGTVTKTLLSLIDATAASAQVHTLSIGSVSPSLIVGTSGVEEALGAPGRVLRGSDDDFSFNPADYPSPEAHQQAVAEVMGLLFPNRSKQVPSGQMHLTSMSIRKRGRKGTSWVPFSKPLEISLPDGSKSNTLYFEDACPAQYARMQRHALKRTRDFFSLASSPGAAMKVALQTKAGEAHPGALVIDFGSPRDEHLHEFILDANEQRTRFVCDGHIHLLDSGANGVDLRFQLNRMVVDITRSGNTFDLVRDIHRAMKEAWAKVHTQACLDVAEDLAFEAVLGSFHYAHRAKPSAEMTAFMKAKAGSNSDIGQLADHQIVLTMEATEALHATNPKVIEARPGGVKLLKLIDQLKISMSKSAFTLRALEAWREAFDANSLAEACKNFVLAMDPDAPSLAMRIIGRSSHRLNAAISENLHSMRAAFGHGGLAALHTPGAVLLACPENSSISYTAEDGRRAAIGLEAMRDAVGEHLSPAARNLLVGQSPRLLCSVFSGAASSLALAVSSRGSTIEALEADCEEYGRKIGEFFSACANDPHKPFFPSASLLSNQKFIRNFLTGGQHYMSNAPGAAIDTYTMRVEDAKLIAMVIEELEGDRTANVGINQAVEILLDHFPNHSKHEAPVIADALKMAHQVGDADYLRPDLTHLLGRLLRDSGMPSCLELVGVMRNEFDRPEDGAPFSHMEILKEYGQSGANYAPLRSPACRTILDQHEASINDPQTRHKDVEVLAKLVFELKIPGAELHDTLVSIPGLRNPLSHVPPRVLMTATISSTPYGLYATRRFIEWTGAKGREPLIDGYGNSRHKIGPSDTLGMAMRAIHPVNTDGDGEHPLSEMDRIHALLERHWGEASGDVLKVSSRGHESPGLQRHILSGAIDTALAQIMDRAFTSRPTEMLSILGGNSKQALEAAANLSANPPPVSAAHKALRTCLDSGSRMGLTALMSGFGMATPEVLEEVARRGSRAQLHDAFDSILRTHGSIPDSHHAPAVAALMSRKDPLLLGDGLRHGLRMGGEDIRAYSEWHSLFTTPELDTEIRARAMHLSAMSHAREAATTIASHEGPVVTSPPARRRSLGL